MVRANALYPQFGGFSLGKFLTPAPYLLPTFNFSRLSSKTNRKTTLFGLQNREVAATRLTWFDTIVFLQRVRR